MSKMSWSEAGRLGYKKSKKHLLKSSHKQMKEAKIRHKEKGKRCLECNKLIPYEKRFNKQFCSRSCVGLYHSAKRRELANVKKKFCLICGTEIEGYSRNRKYCSPYCFQMSRTIKNARLLVNNKPHKFTNKTIKGLLFLIREVCCEICGRKTWCGKEIPLILDHIDGNSYNNKYENLRLVCGNCDMQLPTYKGKNKGKGRYSRRKRYQEGKSY